MQGEPHARWLLFYIIPTQAKAFGCVDHNKLWKILKEMSI